MGEKEGKHSNSHDDALFRDAVGDVQPVRSRPRHTPSAARARRPRASTDHPAEVFTGDLGTEVGEQLWYERSALQPRQRRDLKRGRIPVRDHCDLHGLKAAPAEALLTEFLDASVAAGHRCVRIVHGKGLNSGARGPVLKRLTNRVLRERSEVLAFCSARPADGGTGAVYVLLRARR